MRVYRCSFCGAPINPGFGIMYIKADGTVLRFCSHRCFVNATKYGRDPRDLAWVRKARKAQKAK
ncbi:MAG: 50S ribosomal protein L24e [Thermoproteus sp.]